MWIIDITGDQFQWKACACVCASANICFESQKFKINLSMIQSSWPLKSTPWPSGPSCDILCFHSSAAVLLQQSKSSWCFKFYFISGASSHFSATLKALAEGGIKERCNGSCHIFQPRLSQTFSSGHYLLKYYTKSFPEFYSLWWGERHLDTAFHTACCFFYFYFYFYIFFCHTMSNFTFDKF